ncbi:MAG TPA: chitobiase/beta-hexosaminidase C-terminal domain-containing protein, partial [Candidatus Binatia bacterium]|nr:chitobiase/beta-hexosaminidase C-terminal domain-containing protein [Candidatus Binatia bacterium]
MRSAPISGGGGSGYRSFIRTDIQSQMLSNNASAFVRIPFTVNNAASFTSLTLQMRYDDGFVAYLNGVEVARRLAPAVTLWNSTATGQHLGADYEDINISTSLSALRDGANVLAIQGLNISSTDTDFLIMAELAEYKALGLTNSYFATPTPGTFNGTPFAGFVGDTHFSHDRGFYETNFAVTITTETPGATIRYTTNGSAPTATTGFIYTTPLPISGTTTLRAAAFKTGLVASDVDTHTYIFVNDVVAQSPSGQRPTPEWPVGPSVNSQVIDYGMDPDIVNNATWGPMVKGALKAIPTFSIVTSLSNLFDSARGIYANPSGDEKTWERPASIELIYPDGKDGFQINAGLRIRGGFSHDGNNPKHAFRFFFRQEYGASKLHYPVFGPDGAEEFDKFDLRTMQNYSWAYQNDSRMICLRDVFSRDAQIAMGQPSTRGDFFHLYVNGQYWGLYNTEERSEASYGETYFGGRAEDYDTIKVDPDLGYNIEATDGDLLAWERLWRAATNGFANDVDYFKVQGLNVDGTPNPTYENLIDVPDLIDYMLVIIYGGNLDAPISNFLSNNSPNNWFGIRNRVGGMGFKFFAHDSEHTLLIENISVDRTGPFAAGDPLQGSSFIKSSPQYIWSRMTANAEFKMLVADHIQKYFFNGGVFSTEGARKSFLVRSNEIQLAIVAESARWGDSKRAIPFTRNDWVTEMNRIYGQFFSQRPGFVLPQLRGDGLWPTVGAPILSSYGGIVPAGFSLTMTNTNTTGTIFYTLDGTDPRLRGGNIAPTALAYSGSITINFSTRVKARVRVSNTSWSPLIDAQFYTAQDFSKLLVSELMYNPPGDETATGN